MGREGTIILGSMPSFLFPRKAGIMGVARTHRRSHRPWPSQREELGVRLMLYCGFCDVESWWGVGAVPVTLGNRLRSARVGAPE